MGSQQNQFGVVTYILRICVYGYLYVQWCTYAHCHIHSSQMVVDAHERLASKYLQKFALKFQIDTGHTKKTTVFIQYCAHLMDFLA